ncbi:MAG TPA: GNAT family N-acetyltransferase [Longimicrobiales bacterium]
MKAGDEGVAGARADAGTRPGDVASAGDGGGAGRRYRAGDVVEVTVTYLQMLRPPETPLPPPPQGVEVRHVRAPSVEYYRRLYHLVGHDWYWEDRLALSDAALRELLEDPRVEVHVLYVDGREAGYAELDRSEPGEVRLMYFGLAPGFIGRGLGRWFLAWAVERAWSLSPGRVWVDTCTLDHPRALGNYERAGFHRFGERAKQVTIPW